MSKQMLINTVEGHECRIAIVHDGMLEELYVERASSASHVGNIYKGRVTNVEPAIQAAFVDFGLNKNGFLHVSDVHPQYFPKGQRRSEPVGRKCPHRSRPPIQDCLRRGQEVLVQMTKEGIGTKGPSLTTYLSIPGRLLVLMPGMSRLGISRRIEDEKIRAKARAALAEIEPPKDMGVIVRTAGVNTSKRDLQRDLNYLLRLWQSVEQRVKNSRPPAEIYQESDLVTRTIRDVLSSEIDRIVCDRTDEAIKVREFLKVTVPRSKCKVEVYVGKGGLFHDFGLEEEIETMHSRRAELPSGGSLVIDQAEALVAIDVNSGRFRGKTDAESTALHTDLEAAREIARQLRLRDLGGLIIIDFIDLRDMDARRKVERALRDGMKTDRAKNKVLPMSSFGIVQMTRQRIRPSLKDSLFRHCEHCDGRGVIKSQESQALLVQRNLQLATANESVARIEVTVTPEVAHHLTNFQRKDLVDLETTTGREIIIHGDPTLSGGDIRITCFNNRGSQVAWEPVHPKKKSSARKPQTISLAEAEERSGVHTAPVAAPPEAEEAFEPLAEVQVAEEAEGETEPTRQKKSKRRGRRGGRRHRKAAAEGAEGAEGAVERDRQPEAGPAGTEQQPPAAEVPTPSEVTTTANDEAEASGEGEAKDEGEASGAKRRRRSRRGGRRRRRSATPAEGVSEPTTPAEGVSEPATPVEGVSEPAPPVEGPTPPAEEPRPAEEQAPPPPEAPAPKRAKAIRKRAKRAATSELAETLEIDSGETRAEELAAPLISGAAPVSEDSPAEPKKKKTRKRAKRAAPKRAKRAAKTEESPAPEEA